MKVSGFTFLRNGVKLGYPFAESIRSILPLVDEFVVALGPSDDGTEERVRAIGDPKIRILPTTWNERIRPDYSIKGFVYGQQKSIALFNCTGDWAFYLEGDELVHEDDLPKIRAAMARHLDNPRVEALIFDYLHFYGNRNTYAWSPRWYRTAPRILRNTIPAWGPKGLFFVVLTGNLGGRYPRAAHAEGRIFHYGYVRTEDQMNLKKQSAGKYWQPDPGTIDYAAVDAATLRPFAGTHPQAIQGWLPPADGLFAADPQHQLTSRERKHRWMMKLENWFGLELSKKHYTRVR